MIRGLLINKKLSELGYIFVKNVNPEYLRSLVNIGCIPVVIYRYHNNRRIVLIYKSVQLGYFDISALDICTIKDIKRVLRTISDCINNYRGGLDSFMKTAFSTLYMCNNRY